MTSNVARLKELLFDSEAQTLAELSERLEGLSRSENLKHHELLETIRQLAQTEKAARSEILTRLDAVFARAGTNEQLESSVADVLDGALRKAEGERYDAVNAAVAPFVVTTVKTEIRNSTDELVEALYPMTGRMVKAYVASAMKDLSDQINRRLETNPVMLYMRSFASGRPVAELAIADSQSLEVVELYLIRRGTGELVSRWPEAASGANRDQVMSGVLTAINEFASEAFSADGTALRQIDLGGQQVYLRVSPAYLLAAKCSGSAPVSVEAVVDDAFLGTIEKLGSEPDSAWPAGHTHSLLSDLSKTLETKIAEKQADVSGRSLGASPVKILAWIMGVPLLAWLAWIVYADYQTERVRSIAISALEQMEQIKGYPTRLDVARLGRSITLTGLVPAQDVRDDVTNRLRKALPGVRVYDELAVVPTALAEIEPQLAKIREETALLQPEIGRVRAGISQLEGRLEKAAVLREAERAKRLMSQTKSEVAGLRSLLATDKKPLAVRISAELDDGLQKLIAQTKLIEASEKVTELTSIQSVFDATAAKLRKSTQDLSELMIASASAPVPPPPASTTAGLVESAEKLAIESERLSMTAVAVAQAIAVRSSIPPPAPIPAPQIIEKIIEKAPTPRERLDAWARANAIFYGADSEYRDHRQADETLDQLASLMRETKLLVRVVGYTDQQGSSVQNTPLSQQRAERIVVELMGRGVPKEQLVAVGRAQSREISASTGPGSSNRRVEFEVGFEGERAP